MKPYQKFIKDERAAIKHSRELITKITMDSVSINAVGNLLARQEEKLKAAGCGTYQWTTQGDGVSFYVSVNDISGFNDPALVETLELLSDLGFEFKSHDYPASLNRDFYAQRVAPNGLSIKVKLNVYARTDSPTCRRIVKSSRMVEAFEYEIECG